MARGRPRSGLPRHPVLPGDPNAALLFDSLHHHGGVSADPADARDGETWMRTDAASAQLWGMHDGVAVLLATPAGVAPSAHASEHHQGGGDPLDLDSIAGTLNGEKITGSIGASTPLTEIIAFDAAFASLAVNTVEPNSGLFTPVAGGGINCGNLSAGTPPLVAIPLGAGMCANLNAQYLDGLLGTDYLSRTNHTGTQAWATVDKTGSSLADLATRSAAALNSGLLDDARLSTNIPRLASLNTYTQGQVVQRTASTNLALRFSTAAGVFTEVMVDGSYAMGVGGSARDVRIRRGAAGEIHIDNNAGGAAKLHVLGEVEVGTALRHSGTTAGFFGTAPAARAAAYTPTNVTTDRAFDADATSLDEVADVLGTLIADLKTYGLLQ